MFIYIVKSFCIVSLLMFVRAYLCGIWIWSHNTWDVLQATFCAQTFIERRTLTEKIECGGKRLSLCHINLNKFQHFISNFRRSLFRLSTLFYMSCSKFMHFGKSVFAADFWCKSTKTRLLVRRFYLDIIKSNGQSPMFTESDRHAFDFWLFDIFLININIISARE